MYTSLHCNTLICIALYCIALILKWVFGRYRFSEGYYWRFYGKFAKVAFEIHESTKLGLLKVWETFETLWSPRSWLLGHLVTRNLKSAKRAFATLWKTAKWSLRRTVAQNLKTVKRAFATFRKTHKVELKMQGKARLTWPAKSAFKMLSNVGFEKPRSGLLQRYGKQRSGAWDAR